MIVIVVSLVVGLASLANPSVQVPVYSTRIFSNTSYYAYPVTMFTASFAPYATSTTMIASYYYEPGNFPGCDPASMACKFGIPDVRYASSTSTYLRLSTAFYSVMSSSQTTVTGQATSTNYRNIPMYTALGLSDLQFIILASAAVLFVVAVILAIAVTKRIEISRNPTNVKTS
jgi:hypothetical protein